MVQNLFHKLVKQQEHEGVTKINLKVSLRKTQQNLFPTQQTDYYGAKSEKRFRVDSEVDLSSTNFLDECRSLM